MLISGGVSTSDLQPRHSFLPGQTLPNVSNIQQHNHIESNSAKWPQGQLRVYQESLI